MTKRFRVMVLASGLSMASVIATAADPAPPAVAPTEDGMTAFALQWFVRLQAGEIDRTQYTAAYSAQLSDSAVRAMSHQLNKYEASPLRAEIMRKRAIGDQTFYQVRLIFPRGDAASVLFGFDNAGKISGVSFESIAGD